MAELLVELQSYNGGNLLGTGNKSRVAALTIHHDLCSQFRETFSSLRMPETSDYRLDEPRIRARMVS